MNAVADTVTEAWEQRYQDLLLDLETSSTGDGLSVAEKHWDALQRSMKGHGFASLEEEIYFFKRIKPLFTAKLEVYHLLKAHITNPLQRLEHFKEKHRDFYEYYRTGKTTHDAVWFKGYSGITSSHDHLAAQLLALEELVQLALFAE